MVRMAPGLNIDRIDDVWRDSRTHAQPWMDAYFPNFFNLFVHDVPTHRAHPGPSHPGLGEIQMEQSDCRMDSLSRCFLDEKGRELSPRSYHLNLQLNSLFRDSYQVQRLVACVPAVATVL